MVNVNELRLGNYVLLDGKYFGKVEAIEKDIVRTYNRFARLVGNRVGGDEWNPDNAFVTPIPLTPEILEKCGFVYWPIAIPKPYWKTNNGFPLYAVNDYFMVRELSHTNLGKVKDLHQLQNLYAVLMGQELEINIPSFA